MLAAEKAEHPIAHNLPAFFDADHQLQAEKVLVMEMCLDFDR